MSFRTKQSFEEELLDELWAFRTELSFDEMHMVWMNFMIQNHNEDFLREKNLLYDDNIEEVNYGKFKE